MKEIMMTKSFALGFLVGILLFIGLNYYTHMQAYMDMCFDCIREFGFPFYFYKTGSIAHYEIILWSGLIADIVIAISASIGIGFIFYFLAAKLFKRSPLK